MTHELVIALITEHYCMETATPVGYLGSIYSNDLEGFLFSQLERDSSVQNVVPASLCSRVLYMAQLLVLTGHPCETWFYHTLQLEFCWSCMTNDKYTTVASCQSCTAQGTRDLYQNKLRRHTAAVPLEFLKIDMLDPVPNTKSGNQRVTFFTCWYTKLARALEVTAIISTNAATLLVNNWAIPYEISTYLSTDNEPQFMSKLFAAVTVRLGFKHLTTTSFHSHTNDQVDRFNRTIVVHLLQYVG